jgi:methyl-accepting chemotaxis protein
MLKHIKISSKIYILGFTQLLLMLIMGGVAISQMSKIGIELIDIAEKNMPLANSLTKLTEHQLEQSILFERALLTVALAKPNFPTNDKHYKEIISHIDELSSTIKEEVSTIELMVKSATDTLHSEEGKREYKSVITQLATIKAHVNDFIGEGQSLLNFVETAAVEDIAKKALHLEESGENLKHELTDLLHEIQDFTLKASLQAEHDEQTGIQLILIAFAVAVVLGAILPLIIGRAISRPIKELAERLNEVAQGDGDLTISLNADAKDETGDVARAFNSFLSILRTLIGSTHSQANVLAESAEIAMKEMSETVTNVDRQRSETEMVAAAVNEMSATTHDVAENALSASKVTETVKEKVTTGQRDALETQTIINKLSQEVAEASSVIQNLVQETNNIGNVLESIQGIAEQTNLLALNAAIEAARAGETGRGFAVVADEVRTLAQRTQTSTVDIQDLLLRLKSEANNAVVSMDKGTESANACLEKSAQTSQTFEEAADAVITISDLNIQIATAAEQQSCVVEEINKNVNNISEMADVTSAGANATSEANISMTQQINELQGNISAFKV